MLDIYIIFANGKVVYVEKKWVNIIIYSILKLNRIIIFAPKVLAQVKTLFIAGQLILHSELLHVNSSMNLLTITIRNKYTKIFK